MHILTAIFGDEGIVRKRLRYLEHRHYRGINPIDGKGQYWQIALRPIKVFIIEFPEEIEEKVRFQIGNDTIGPLKGLTKTLFGWGEPKPVFDANPPTNMRIFVLGEKR